MLLGENNNLENHVIHILAHSGKAKVEDVLDAFGRDEKGATVQGVYRVLRKLQKEGVISKERSSYSLRIPWLLELASLVDTMEDTYLNKEYLKQLLPAPGAAKKVWTFSNLLKMNDVRMHILLALTRHIKKGIALQYAPHDWFTILNMRQAAQFKKSFLEHINKSYVIIGGQSYVDKYIRALSKTEKEETYLAPEEDCVEQERNMYVDVIDDYILTIKLDDHTTKNIDTLYNSIASEDDMHLLDIFETFTGKVKVKMIIKEDPRKAGVYRRKVTNAFGPLR